MYKNLHNDTKQHSWRLFNGTQRNRVDYFLVSEHLGLDIAGADIMPAYCSDHSLVYIGFKSNIVKRHHPLSKFKNSLFQDTAFVNLIKHVILNLEGTKSMPVCDKNNIHKIKEELVLTTDDFFNIFF